MKDLTMAVGGGQAEERPTPDALNQKLLERLVGCLQGVLSSGVTRRALRDPKSMEPGDIVLNLHLFERLFIAASIVKRLRGYAVPAAWLADSFTAEDLAAGLAELEAR